MIFSDFALSRYLAPFAETVVEFTPSRPGTYGFACGMNMIHGSLLIDGAAVEGAAATVEIDDSGDEDAETLARRAEVADLSRRLIVGTALTLPVLFAVMGRDLFGAEWIPMWLMNPWLQFALIAPVMGWVGWPIHRTGWLALAPGSRHEQPHHPGARSPPSATARWSRWRLRSCPLTFVTCTSRLWA